MYPLAKILLGLFFFNRKKLSLVVPEYKLLLQRQCLERENLIVTRSKQKNGKLQISGQKITEWMDLKFDQTYVMT